MPIQCLNKLLKNAVELRGPPLIFTPREPERPALSHGEGPPYVCSKADFRILLYRLCRKKIAKKIFQSLLFTYIYGYLRHSKKLHKTLRIRVTTFILEIKEKFCRTQKI